MIKGDIISAIVERDIHPLVAQLLVEKGIYDEVLLDVTFNPIIENLVPPEMMMDVEQAAKVVAKYIGRKENILVWGHDDADGITGVSILLDALKTCGARVFYFIPDKKSQGGHSINEEGLRYAKQNDVKLIITTDCCTNSTEDINKANSVGIEVIITDHHEILVENPTYLLINPKRGGSYPYLSGSVVAFKFAWHMLKLMKHWSLEDMLSEKPQYVVWAALGIIADRVPIFSENKAVFSKAEEIFLSYTFPFSKSYENVRGKKPSLYDMMSVIASSRTAGDKHEGVELLTTGDINIAEEIMKRLTTLSDIWYNRAENILEEALQNISTSRPYILVNLGKRGLGYLGYVANKLKEKYKIPVIAIGKRDDGGIVGELRSPQGFDTLQLLENLSWMLIDYGGHRLASGFSMDEAFLPSFLEEVDTYFSRLGEIDYTEASADMKININDIDEKFFKDLSRVGYLGLSVNILIKGRLGDINNHLLVVRVMDEQGYLGLYSADTKVKVLIQTTQDGLKVEDLKPES